jgi:hypothetical protein
MKSVDCTSLRDALRAGDLPEGPAERAHVEACPACSQLFADGARLGRALGEDAAAAAPAPELWARTESRIRSETGVRAWLRSRPTWRRTLLALGAGALTVKLVVGRHAHGGLAAGDAGAWLWLVLFTAVVATGVVVLLRPLGRAASPPAVRVGLAVAALLLPVLYALAPHAMADGGHALAGGELARRTLACLLLGFGLGLPFLGIVWALDRADRLSLPAVLLLAGASGLLASLGLSLHCPLDGRAHLLFGHAPVAVALALAVLVARAVARRG